MKTELSTKKTVVIVTCCRDMWGFEMLAKSMRKNLSPCNVIVIVNEEDVHCNAWFYWYNQYIKTFLKPHSVNVYKRSDIYDFVIPIEHRQDGWVNQQVLKIFASELVNTPEYVCIDSKNFFFRKTDVDDIKQVEQTTGWLWPWLEEWAKNCCNTLNVEYTDVDSFALTQNITPFVLNTQWARELTNFWSNKQGFFNVFFQMKLPANTCSPSEFILYDIFCKKYNYVNTETVQQNSAVVWEHSLDYEQELYEYILEAYRYHGVTVSGFHSGLKGKFTISDCVKILNRISARSFLPTSVDPPF